ncbi:MAG: TonB family protein [Acidobacteriaceae bacterium]|nr:TonB family protein [Acidobacteriaceae bacterium]
MPTTQIPPASPPSSPADQPGRELYDPRYWESAYREIDEPPALLLQLQDDLSRSRRREAFWISVVVHLVVVLAIVNSDKLARLMPRQAAVVQPRIVPTDKDLTFLELPPDEQKVTKRPDTNIISDKDRIATSKTPQLDRKELKHILDSSRPGAPGMSTPPPSPAQPPSPPAAAQSNPPIQQQQQQQGQQQQAAAPNPPPNQMAKLQTPPVGSKNPFANSNPLSAGSAIEQAARAAAANHGSYGGDGGDFGLGMGKQGRAFGALDVLSDTMGVDFGPYLARVLHDVKVNWYDLIPESARPPIMKKGKVAIEFAILKDGSIAGMRLEQGGSSGDPALDRAAWGGITGSNPFPPLPQEFGGQYLALRFHFFYNPDKADLQ